MFTLLLCISMVQLSTSQTKEVPFTIDTVPADGAKDVPGGMSITATFSQAATAVKFTLKSKDGKEVTGDTVLAPDNFGATFDPYGSKAPIDPSLRLASNTSYTLDIDADGHKKTISFTTSNLGMPLNNDVNLKGKTYVMDLSSATFEEPPNLFQTLSQMGKGDSFPKLLLGISDMAMNPAKLTFLGAMACGMGGDTPAADCPASSDPLQMQQDKTKPTLTFPQADFKNPFFSVGPQTFAIEIMKFKVDIDNLFMSGVVSPDGSYIGEGRLEGVIDLKKILAAAGAGANMTPESVCGIMETLTGRPCIACADKVNSCVLVRMTNMKALRAPKAEPLTAVAEPKETKEAPKDATNTTTPEKKP